MSEGSSSAVATRRRILIVDDHELLRNGLRLMMGNEPDLEVCGESADEATALALVRDVQPDVVVIDIVLKSGNGLDLVKRIRDSNPLVRLIVSSMHGEQLYGERALRAGADGYVSKQDPARAILHAIRRVLEGKMYFSDELTKRVLEHTRLRKEGLQSPIELLSDRELEVFRLIGQGIGSAEIARQLHVSRSTIDTYRERLKVKLSVANGAQLTREATLWASQND